MAERNLIYVDPASETGRLLKLVGNEPVTIESDGIRYRIERDEPNLIADYDPEKVRKALHSLIGIYEGLDIEEFKREILEQREQDSIGRPAQ